MFKVTDFKLYRLWWLLYVIPYTGLLLYLWFDQSIEPTLFEYSSHIVSMLAVLGVVFYAIGMRSIHQNFWKLFLPFAIFEEHYNILEDMDGTWDAFLVPNVMVSIPFVALYLYAYKRQQIWIEQT